MLSVAPRALRMAARESRRYLKEEEEGTLAGCPYYRGKGTCESGCWTEPMCITDEPLGGWPRPWVLKRRRHEHRLR